MFQSSSYPKACNPEMSTSSHHMCTIMLTTSLERVSCDVVTKHGQSLCNFWTAASALVWKDSWSMWDGPSFTTKQVMSESGHTAAEWLCIYSQLCYFDIGQRLTTVCFSWHVGWFLHKPYKYLTVNCLTAMTVKYVCVNCSKFKPKAWIDAI